MGITSRCYRYANASLNRCYGSTYDGVGNPVRMTDPEGTDVIVYDNLDRMVSVTRNDNQQQRIGPGSTARAFTTFIKVAISSSTSS